MNNEMTTDNMSNEEVIEVLKGIVFGGFDRTTLKERQALDLAIKALEEGPQDCSNCKRYDFPYFEIKIDKEQMQEFVDKAKAEVLASIERSQGEWIYGEDECGQDGWFCSKCNFFVPWYYQYYEKDIDFIRDYKACPHCLAEMITYTGKDRDTKGGKEE